MTGVAVARGYVDGGYRRHGLDRRHIFVSGQRCGVTATIGRELRRRSAIEPMIGHMTADVALTATFSPVCEVTRSTPCCAASDTISA
jgi:IS5 family transposase